MQLDAIEGAGWQEGCSKCGSGARWIIDRDRAYCNGCLMLRLQRLYADATGYTLVTPRGLPIERYRKGEVHPR